MTRVSTIPCREKHQLRYELFVPFSLALRERNPIHGANKGESVIHPLYSVSSRKLLAHVRLSYERKRESLPGANSLSLLPLGSLFSGRTKRKGGHRKNDLCRALTRHSSSSYLTRLEYRPYFFIVKRIQNPLIL